MFSFFKKKDHDSSSISKQTDEFVVVESGDQQPDNSTLYPTLIPPLIPYPPNNPSMSNTSQDSSPFPLIKDVPFSLSKLLSSDNTCEILLIEVKEILRHIEKQLEDDYCQYDFSTEKSVLSEFAE